MNCTYLFRCLILWLLVEHAQISPQKLTHTDQSTANDDCEKLNAITPARNVGCRRHQQRVRFHFEMRVSILSRGSHSRRDPIY